MALDAGERYHYETGAPMGYGLGTVPAALGSALSGVVSVAVLLTLAQVLDVLRAVTGRPAPLPLALR